MIKILLIAVSFLAISCATPYQKAGFRGGYSETQLSADMYEVHFRGNGYTDSQAVKTYLLRRCAEVTQANGYTHFLPVSADRRTDTNYSSTYNANSNQFNTFEVSKHENSMVIKLLNNPDPKSFAYDASIILGKDSQSNRLPAWNDQ